MSATLQKWLPFFQTLRVDTVYVQSHVKIISESEFSFHQRTLG
jgi:hypothetical protein